MLQRSFQAIVNLIAGTKRAVLWLRRQSLGLGYCAVEDQAISSTGIGTSNSSLGRVPTVL